MKSKFVHQSIEQLQSKNERAGYYFFSESSKRFFSSRIGSNTFAGADGWYFTTSEQFDWKSPRLYTVRRMTERGSVDTVGEFQAYRTSDSAKRAAQRLAELSLHEGATCPTSNGRDLELWEQLPHALEVA